MSTPITVISIEDWHPVTDGGEAFVPETEVGPGRFGALIPIGDGGYIALPDLGLDGGYDTIPGGPNAGSFFVRQYGTLTETTSHVIDWSQDFLGKPSFGVVSTPTPVTFNLTGFTPFGASDLIELNALNDDTYEDTALQTGVSFPDGGTTFTVGETAVSGTVDWSTYGTNGSADGQAPEITAGDPFFAAKFTTTDAGAGGAQQFTRLDSFVDLTGQGITHGVPSTITGTAVTQTLTKALSVVLTQPTQAQTSQFPAGTTYQGVFYDLGAQPSALAQILPYVQNDLAYGNLAAGLTPVTLSFNYANPYPSNWDEVFFVQRTYKMPVTVSASPGGTYTQVEFQISYDLARNLGATQSAGMGPVGNLKVNGVSADTNLGPVGTTPTISWDKPLTGTPTSYRVGLTELAYDATAQRVTPTPRGGATLLATTTSFTFPPNRLQPGKTYLVQVLANYRPNSDLSTRPARLSLPLEYSRVSTHLLTP